MESMPSWLICLVGILGNLMVVGGICYITYSLMRYSDSKKTGALASMCVQFNIIGWFLGLAFIAAFFLTMYDSSIYPVFGFVGSMLFLPLSLTNLVCVKKYFDVNLRKYYYTVTVALFMVAIASFLAFMPVLIDVSGVYSLIDVLYLSTFIILIACELMFLKRNNWHFLPKHPK